MATPKLALQPNDTPYVGRVTSATRIPNDTLGPRYLLLLETLKPWGPYSTGQTVGFDAPGYAIWQLAQQYKEVVISRPQEGGQIARYVFDLYQEEDGVQPEVTDRDVPWHASQENPDMALQGTGLKKKVLGAYQFAHQVLEWYNKECAGGKLSEETMLPTVSALAHSLLIGEQHGKLVVPEYQPSKS